ncbi:MAG TPA: gliding motility-associated ABC transporter ATP-binding subunit GldA [Flavisolibacter sp.]|nr:gliding motility-associated ABC transporter ATP-binding subunit GldA [Flavisolibacter sp.]
MSISVKNLTKMYGEQKAVDTISFSINKGEIVGFLGPNGAGKSTTMKMITGYLYPEAGEIDVSGIDVKKNPLEAKKKIGYLPESNALYYDMYVREYLDFIADIHDVKNKKQRIEEVITLTGLQTESKKKIGQLSKGYKQRTGLAAALLHDPEVLILDEPTSGLDPNQIIEIRQVIKEQGKNKMVLFSSHILQEVEAICDRVIIINKGKIIADDSLTNLQKRSNTNVVIVGFKELLDDEWMNQLKGIISIVKTDANHWKIETEEPEMVRKQLLELSLQHNLNIVSLQSEHESLEEVFRTLTSAS